MRELDTELRRNFPSPLRGEGQGGGEFGEAEIMAPAVQEAFGCTPLRPLRGHLPLKGGGEERTAPGSIRGMHAHV